VVNVALRRAPAVALQASVVSRCLDLDKRPQDVLFAIAWARSLPALARHERRGALSGVTGHVAESVVEILLADLGYHPLHHFVGPGRHGIDLLMLAPGCDHVLAIEVKGTLRPRHVPRLSRSAVAQMSAVWVDKADNPGMVGWELHSDDIYAAVIAVNFADMLLRAAVSGDFDRWRPVGALEELAGVVHDLT
jgi:hypothetical protein